MVQRSHQVSTEYVSHLMRDMGLSSIRATAKQDYYSQVMLLTEYRRPDLAEITVHIIGYKDCHPFSIHSTSCSSTTSESRK